MTTDILEQAEYVKRGLTTFSPRGRLHAVERSVSAATAPSPSNNLCIALKCQEGWLIVSTLPSSPYFHKNDSDDDDDHDDMSSLLIQPPSTMIRAPFARVASSTVVATGGNVVHSQILVNVIHQLATNMEEAEDGGLWMGTTSTTSPRSRTERQSASVSSAQLARQIADHLQKPTQSIAKGPILACSVLLLGGSTTRKTNKDETSFCWRIDPTGQFYRSTRAAVVGYEATKAEQTLVKKLGKKKDGNELLPLSQAKKLIRECIEEVMVSSTSGSTTSGAGSADGKTKSNKLKLCGLLLSSSTPLMTLSDSDLTA